MPTSLVAFGAVLFVFDGNSAASSDPEAIFTYLEAENPAAAVLIDAAARRSLDFPASGRVGEIAGTRELVINGTPYVAA